MRWKIHYADRSTYSSGDGPPEDAPGLGVQVIAQDHPDHGRQLVSSLPEAPFASYYWFVPGDGWYVGDLFGLWEYLARPGPKIVKFGRSVPTAKFRDIYRQARKDPWLPQKSAASKAEQRWEPER